MLKFARQMKLTWSEVATALVRGERRSLARRERKLPLPSPEAENVQWTHRGVAFFPSTFQANFLLSGEARYLETRQEVLGDQGRFDGAAQARANHRLRKVSSRLSVRIELEPQGMNPPSRWIPIGPIVEELFEKVARRREVWRDLQTLPRLHQAHRQIHRSLPGAQPHLNGYHNVTWEVTPHLQKPVESFVVYQPFG